MRRTVRDEMVPAVKLYAYAYIAVLYSTVHRTCTSRSTRTRARCLGVIDADPEVRNDPSRGSIGERLFRGPESVKASLAAEDTLAAAYAHGHWNPRKRMWTASA